MNGTDNLDADWMAYELNQDAQYVAWLQINDPDRIPGYLIACDYDNRLAQWKACRT